MSLPAPAFGLGLPARPLVTGGIGVFPNYLPQVLADLVARYGPRMALAGTVTSPLGLYGVLRLRVDASGRYEAQVRRSGAEGWVTVDGILELTLALAAASSGDIDIVGR